MKPNIKVGSFLLAIVMMFSVFAIAGCTPTTLNKEWSYKTSDNELAIGVYIYSLNAAYSQAESYAKKLDDYDSTSDKWLDEKIKDDDGNTVTYVKSDGKTGYARGSSYVGITQRDAAKKTDRRRRKGKHKRG